MISAVLFFVSVFQAIRVAMVELIQNLQDIYSKWENKAKPQINFSSRYRNKFSHEYGNKHSDDENYSKLSSKNLQNGRTQFWRNCRRSKHKFSLDIPRWHGVAQFKMSPTVVLENSSLRPFVGTCCPRCLPISHAVFDSDPATMLGIRNMLRVPTQNRENGILTRTFHYAVYILQRNLSFAFQDVSSNVLKSERVQQAVEKAVEQETNGVQLSNFQLSSLCEKHKLRAKQILQMMKSSVSPLLLKLSGWLLFKLFGRMLSGIHVHKGQVEALKRISQNNKPVIYLPLHRSHLDYILVSFIICMNDLRAPLIAAGDNLLIPFFGNLMRGLGAFFIKRKLDPGVGKKDFIYRAILHSYMVENLKEGHNLEFFIEGGRSRTGKACLPKAGLLSVVVDSLIDGFIDDAYIVPVAISYDKIMDGNFVSEQLGRPKIMETFSAAVMSIWKTLHSNFGAVRVDFCQPFSLKEFLESAKHFSTIPRNNITSSNSLSDSSNLQSSDISSYSLYCTDFGSEDVRGVIKDLADHVVYDASNAAALMSTNLLSFLLLTKHRKGGTLPHLIQSLNWLRDELNSRKRDVGFTGDSSDVIKHAAFLLGKDLVTMETIKMEWSSSDMENNNLKIVFYKPVISIPYVLELQYYANSVVPVFLLESVVVNALFAVLDEEIDSWKGCERQLVIQRHTLVKKALQLCDILQYEFLFAPPCTDLSSIITDTVEQLIASEHLSVIGVCTGKNLEKRAWANRIAASMEFEEDQDDYLPEYKDQELKVNLTESSINSLQFLRCILSPYIESYWLAACSLLKLVHAEKEDGVFLREMQRTAQDRLHKGLLTHEESFAAEPLRNSLKLFASWQVIEYYHQDCVKILYLHENYNSEEGVSEIISRIEEFRK